MTFPQPNWAPRLWHEDEAVDPHPLRIIVAPEPLDAFTPADIWTTFIGGAAGAIEAVVTLLLRHVMKPVVDADCDYFEYAADQDGPMSERPLPIRLEALQEVSGSFDDLDVGWTEHDE
jgi:hypothetical protein